MYVGRAHPSLFSSLVLAASALVPGAGCADPEASRADDAEGRDGDGWLDPEDCDDADPEIHRVQEEACDGGVDQDCEGVERSSGVQTEKDADGDGAEDLAFAGDSDLPKCGFVLVGCSGGVRLLPDDANLTIEPFVSDPNVAAMGGPDLDGDGTQDLVLRNGGSRCGDDHVYGFLGRVDFIPGAP